MIFFYLVCGIFFKSDLYKDFDILEYEPEGANNKRFEYAFKMKNSKNINVEVKALDCDPFSKDNLDMFQLKDGDILGKTFFPNTKLDEFINKEDFKEIIEISSNYRQVKRNIKLIKKKCKPDKDINIGFIIINYGTSREEYFSYLLHSKKGILNLINIDGVDNLALFSMCTCNTLMFNEVYEKNHILSVVMKDREFSNILFEKLRLDNYIFKNGEVNEGIRDIIDDEYGMYKYISRNGMVTILPYDLDDSIVDKETQKLKNMIDGSKLVTDNINK